MRIRSRRSFNGVLFGFVVVLITLLVLGIVTGKIVFYILFAIILFFAILGVIGLFTFLKKTGQTTSPTRRSTYDITKGEDLANGKDSKISEKSTEVKFCDSCGMKLDPGTKTCNNCGKTSK
ncbi:MAG: zinc ribbon domain-containing protein [Asgard group archaeon]|nr:zinc ribbon domain-containing protein [Asgard group archaeon]